MYFAETRRAVHERLNELPHPDGTSAFTDELISPPIGNEPKALKTGLPFTVPILNPFAPPFLPPISVH